MCTFYLVGSDTMNKDEYYMNLALAEARKAYLKDEVPVGVIIVQNDKIIATGYNLRETTGNILKHAELIAIERAGLELGDWRLLNTTMYITLFPCPMCASAIVQSRIKKVVIGAPTIDDKNAEIVRKILEGNNTSPKVEMVEEILEKDCKNLLSNFFKERRKVKE